MSWAQVPGFTTTRLMPLDQLFDRVVREKQTVLIGVDGVPAWHIVPGDDGQTVLVNRMAKRKKNWGPTTDFDRKTFVKAMTSEIRLVHDARKNVILYVASTPLTEFQRGPIRGKDPTLMAVLTRLEAMPPGSFVSFHANGRLQGYIQMEDRRFHVNIKARNEDDPDIIWSHQSKEGATEAIKYIRDRAIELGSPEFKTRYHSPPGAVKESMQRYSPDDKIGHRVMKDGCTVHVYFDREKVAEFSPILYQQVDEDRELCNLRLLRKLRAPRNDHSLKPGLYHPSITGADHWMEELTEYAREERRNIRIEVLPPAIAEATKWPEIRGYGQCRASKRILKIAVETEKPVYLASEGSIDWAIFPIEDVDYETGELVTCFKIGAIAELKTLHLLDNTVEQHDRERAELWLKDRLHTYKLDKRPAKAYVPKQALAESAGFKTSHTPRRLPARWVSPRWATPGLLDRMRLLSRDHDRTGPVRPPITVYIVPEKGNDRIEITCSRPGPGITGWSKRDENPGSFLLTVHTDNSFKFSCGWNMSTRRLTADQVLEELKNILAAYRTKHMNVRLWVPEDEPTLLEATQTRYDRKHKDDPLDTFLKKVRMMGKRWCVTRDGKPVINVRPLADTDFHINFPEKNRTWSPCAGFKLKEMIDKLKKLGKVAYRVEPGSALTEGKRIDLEDVIPQLEKVWREGGRMTVYYDSKCLMHITPRKERDFFNIDFPGMTSIVYAKLSAAGMIEMLMKQALEKKQNFRVEVSTKDEVNPLTEAKTPAAETTNLTEQRIPFSGLGAAFERMDSEGGKIMFIGDGSRPLAEITARPGKTVSICAVDHPKDSGFELPWDDAQKMLRHALTSHYNQRKNARFEYVPAERVTEQIERHKVGDVEQSLLKIPKGGYAVVWRDGMRLWRVVRRLSKEQWRLDTWAENHWQIEHMHFVPLPSMAQWMKDKMARIRRRSLSISFHEANPPEVPVVESGSSPPRRLPSGSSFHEVAQLVMMHAHNSGQGTVLLTDGDPFKYIQCIDSENRVGPKSTNAWVYTDMKGLEPWHDDVEPTSSNKVLNFLTGWIRVQREFRRNVQVQTVPLLFEPKVSKLAGVVRAKRRVTEAAGPLMRVGSVEAILAMAENNPDRCVVVYGDREPRFAVKMSLKNRFDTKRQWYYVYDGDYMWSPFITHKPSVLPGYIRGLLTRIRRRRQNVRMGLGDEGLTSDEKRRLVGLPNPGSAINESERFFRVGDLGRAMDQVVRAGKRHRPKIWFMIDGRPEGRLFTWGGVWILEDEFEKRSAGWGPARFRGMGYIRYYEMDERDKLIAKIEGEILEPAREKRQNVKLFVGRQPPEAIAESDMRIQEPEEVLALMHENPGKAIAIVVGDEIIKAFYFDGMVRVLTVDDYGSGDAKSTPPVTSRTFVNIYRSTMDALRREAKNARLRLVPCRPDGWLDGYDWYILSESADGQMLRVKGEHDVMRLIWESPRKTGTLYADGEPYIRIEAEPDDRLTQSIMWAVEIQSEGQLVPYMRGPRWEITQCVADFIKQAYHHRVNLRLQVGA